MLVPWTENVDEQQLAAAIRANSSLEDVTIASFCVRGMGVHSGWAGELLSSLQSHPTLCKLQVQANDDAETAMVNATESVLRSTKSLQCLELSLHFDKELLRGILEALPANQTLSSLKLGMARFDEEATSDFAHFIRHECNRNGNIMCELRLENPNPHIFGTPADTSLGKVMAGMPYSRIGIRSVALSGD
jgi:hypothetical protein